MFYEKEEAKDYFEKEIMPLIIKILFDFKGIEFFIGLRDNDETTLRKDINYFKEAYQSDLNEFLRSSFKLFDILPDYLNQVKRFADNKENLSSEQIDEQMAKVREIRNNLNNMRKYYEKWIENSDAYYKERLKTISFESEENNQISISADSLSREFFFINPLKVWVGYRLNLNRVNEIPVFIQEIWLTHFEFFSPKDKGSLDVYIPGMSEVERKFNFLKMSV
jgi:hypothetical protein